MVHSTHAFARVVWLQLLLLLWGILLFGGYVFGGEEQIPRSARMASSFILVVAAWSWLAFTRNPQTVVFRLLLAAGMMLGFLGDLFMAELVPVGQPVFGGIAAFGCAHLAYIAAFVYLGRPVKSGEADVWGTALLVWLLVGLIGWSVIVLPSLQPTGLRMAALCYTLLLATTAGCAWGLAIQMPPFRLLAIGAGLFLLSDLILATGLFGGMHSSLVGNAVWLTYGPAQMLIIYGGNAGLGELRREREETGTADPSLPQEPLTQRLNLQEQP
jgi:hypothetical protein